MKKILIYTLSVLALASCNSGAPTYITTGEAPMAKIQVSATGTSNMAPDMATVSAGVVTQGKTAREAMFGNATKMTRVFEELEAAGIEKKYITTSQLSLQPKYNYQNRQAPRIDGYEARNTVSAKTYDLDSVGAMLDALVKAGVNNINGVQFSIKDSKAARDKAREEAILEAREKAESMAAAAGVKLGKLKSLSESGGNFNPRPVAYAMEARSAGASTPVSAGEQTISVTVNMSYDIID
ncbi:SIMPL domain-containing protein [Hellea balneolensis]|uniref:SIMPL domain-containing protein n=1 Tax=Hellea balneolensis TaxID=287478 RepID=UPI00047BC851|nr:SIMPL domain-containing protein [Hellea balneolensis]